MKNYVKSFVLKHLLTPDCLLKMDDIAAASQDFTFIIVNSFILGLETNPKRGKEKYDE